MDGTDPTESGDTYENPISAVGAAAGATGGPKRGAGWAGVTAGRRWAGKGRAASAYDTPPAGSAPEGNGFARSPSVDRPGFNPAELSNTLEWMADRQRMQDKREADLQLNWKFNADTGSYIDLGKVKNSCALPPKIPRWCSAPSSGHFAPPRLLTVSALTLRACRWGGKLATTGAFVFFMGQDPNSKKSKNKRQPKVVYEQEDAVPKPRRAWWWSRSSRTSGAAVRAARRITAR
eukprot:SAG22_NODE_428_length_10591_cov_8.858178_6_plen_234_part_00